MPESFAHYLSQGEAAGARYRLAPPRSATLGTVGSQLARAAGESLEFMEHREYEPGDDLRRINWSTFARTDELIVKVYQHESCPHLDLVIDGSRSMMLPDSEKLRATLGLSAALATAADNSRYSRRVYLARDGCHHLPGSSENPGAWQGLAFDATRSPADSFRMLPPSWRPRGIRVLISDLLWLGDPLEVLNAMAHRAASVFVLQVLASSDVNPADLGNRRLVDCETGETQEAFIDAAGQARYQKNLARHQQDWHQAARKVGATLVTLVAEDLCRTWDLSPLVRAEALVV